MNFRSIYVYVCTYKKRSKSQSEDSRTKTSMEKYLCIEVKLFAVFMDAVAEIGQSQQNVQKKKSKIKVPK